MYSKIIIDASFVVRRIAKNQFAQLNVKNITQNKDGSFVTDFDIAIDTELTIALKKYFLKLLLYQKNLRMM